MLLLLSLRVVSDFVTPWAAAHQASLSITNSQSLLKLMSLESVMPSNHLILCHPFLLLPSVFPNIQIFSSESALHIWWPKYWSFSFSISPSNVHPGLISFRRDWLDLPAVQGTLKSLLQHHSSKASSLRHSAFFTVQLSHPYVTAEKTVALTLQTFVGKVTSLLLNVLSGLVTTFLCGVYFLKLRPTTFAHPSIPACGTAPGQSSAPECLSEVVGQCCPEEVPVRLR